MDITALRDHASDMLRVIADDLDLPQTAQAQADKAKGESDADAQLELGEEPPPDPVQSAEAFPLTTKPEGPRAWACEAGIRVRAAAEAVVASSAAERLSSAELIMVEVLWV